MNKKQNFVTTTILYALGVMIFLTSCSTQKDAWPNRLYHQLNTKYNGLFYAEKYLLEGRNKAESLHIDDYKKILKINKYGDIKGAQSSQASLDQAIEKSKLAIQQHSMDIKGKEKNRLIDNNYMVIGKALFYKHDYNQAINTFSYLIRQSSKAETQSEALLWTTRCHQELGNRESLRKNISLLEEEYYLNRRQDAVLEEIQSEIAIKEKYYAEAIHHLQKTLQKIKNKNKKIRIHYILGQLNLLLSEPKLHNALQHFNQVIKKNPEYELVFNAKLMRAKTYIPDPNNSQQKTSFTDLKKGLQQMLKDDKNIEYKDQIYFALGNLELTNTDTLACLRSLQLSTTYSLYNNHQKLESHYLLANLFWGQKNYIEAYHHSDSAYQLSDSKMVNYNDIKNMRRSAKKVATQYSIINQNDSIINLAKLPEEERNEIINNYISTLKEAEQAEKLSRENSTGSNFNSYEFNRQSQNSMSISSGGGWYFYNPSAISLGYSEFLSRWGNRKLEDNWRRKNKNQIMSSEEMAEAENTLGPNDKQKYSRDYYLDQLPLDPEQQLLLLAKIETAYYDLAGIFKADLEDYSQAIFVYNQLIERFSATDYKQLIYFDLHNICKLQNDSTGAANYLNKIQEEYPNSNYLKALLGDTVINIDLERDKKAHESAHNLYTTFSLESCKRLQELLDTNKNNMFIAQIELLNVFCQAQKSDKKAFIQELQGISKKYPKTNTSNKADTIILILKGELDFNTQSIYENEFNTEHYFILAIEDVSINLPELQSSISKFNNQNYKLDSLEITNLLLNKATQLLRVGVFKNKETAIAYYELIKENQSTQKTIIKPQIQSFVISKNNHKTLLKEKNINDYFTYFNGIYLLN